MNPLRRFATAALVALILASLAVPNAHAVTIDWATVGDPGNANDTTGYGAVSYEYRIMKFEFTNDQYAAFLNAIDPDGTNPNSVYNANMGSNGRGGITNTGTTAGSIYAAKENMGGKPVIFVNWWDAGPLRDHPRSTRHAARQHARGRRVGDAGGGHVRDQDRRRALDDRQGQGRVGHGRRHRRRRVNRRMAVRCRLQHHVAHPGCRHSHGSVLYDLWRRSNTAAVHHCEIQPRCSCPETWRASCCIAWRRSLRGLVRR